MDGSQLLTGIGAIVGGVLTLIYRRRPTERYVQDRSRGTGQSADQSSGRGLHIYAVFVGIVMVLLGATFIWMSFAT